MAQNENHSIFYIKKEPVLIAECSVLSGNLHSIVLATVDVFRPVARIARLDGDSFAVHIGERVGTIEKTTAGIFATTPAT